MYDVPIRSILYTVQCTLHIVQYTVRCIVYAAHHYIIYVTRRIRLHYDNYKSLHVEVFYQFRYAQRGYGTTAKTTTIPRRGAWITWTSARVTCLLDLSSFVIHANQQ